MPLPPRFQRWLGWVVLSCCAPVVQAQEPDLSRVEIRVTHVAGNVYLLQGGTGGNVAACVGPDGIVLVDDLFAPLADKVRAALKTLSDQPVRYVINTHYHGDHTLGNEAFAGAGAVIVAQENVRTRLANGGVGGNFASFRFDYAPSPKAALPAITFRDELTLHLNGEDIRIKHVPNSHTDGDSVVFFSKANVVHVGDEFVSYGFPDIEIASGGSVTGTIAVLKELLRDAHAGAKIIPGHGPVSSAADVRRFLVMLEETQAAVKRGIQHGKSLAQLKQDRVLEPWKAWSGFFTTDVFTEFLYNDLSGVRHWPEAATSTATAR